MPNPTTPKINAVKRADLQPTAALRPNELDPALYIINPNPHVLNNVPRHFWKIVGDELVEMDQAEKDQVTSEELGPAKRAKCAQIIMNTAAVMEQVGFQHNGKEFSLDPPTMTRYLALVAGKAFLTYPLYLPTKDGQDFEAISGVNDMQAFGQAMTEAIDSNQIAEKAIIDQINALTNLDLVENFVDPRL